MKLGVLSLVIFGTQFLVAWLVYGAPVIDAVVLGHPEKYAALSHDAVPPDPHRPRLRPGHAPDVRDPLVILGGRSPVEAVRASVRSVVGAPLAFTACTVFGGGLMVAALATHYVGLALMLPASTWLLTTGYVAYRDLFGE